MTEQHNFPFMSEADAGAQQQRVREIMTEQQLDFGPAVDAYIGEKAVTRSVLTGLQEERILMGFHQPGLVDTSGWDAA